jgi:hypothetical protein
MEGQWAFLNPAVSPGYGKRLDPSRKPRFPSPEAINRKARHRDQIISSPDSNGRDLEQGGSGPGPLNERPVGGTRARLARGDAAPELQGYVMREGRAEGGHPTVVDWSQIAARK